MNYSDFKSILSNVYETNDSKIVEYLEDKTFDENIFLHMEEIFDSTNIFFSSDKMILLKMILERVKPKITLYLTPEKLNNIANKISNNNFDKYKILVMFEPFIGQLSSISFYKMIEIFITDKYNLLEFVKLFIEKVKELKCKYLFKILLHYFNNNGDNQDCMREYYIEQLLKIVSHKIINYFTFIAKILNFVVGYKCEIITYIMIKNFKEFDMDYYNFIDICKNLNKKNYNFFAKAFIKANNDFGWKFEISESYTEKKFCKKLSSFLDSHTYDNFTKIFINNQDFINEYHPNKKEIKPFVKNILINQIDFKPKDEFLNSILEQNKKEGRTISTLNLTKKENTQRVEIIYNDRTHLIYNGSFIV
ncbi:hypothetical protein LBA_01058 [Megavirus lba]|uniref:Uncharacterized protein n=1 Tax=Megavirus lba TaxID=1235314 RepID=L7Y5W6_9VIRU|nr:hypothetical protein LBA_01058 [Megavirus lba]